MYRLQTTLWRCALGDAVRGDGESQPEVLGVQSESGDGEYQPEVLRCPEWSNMVVL